MRKLALDRIGVIRPAKPEVVPKSASWKLS